MWVISAIINFMAILACGIATIHNVCNGDENGAIFAFVLLLVNLVCLIGNISKFME